jgi:uncharacterized protein YjiS (DUF1127 family)
MSIAHGNMVPFIQKDLEEQGAVRVRDGWLRRLAGKLLFELEVRRDLRHLQGFDDIRLRDIGLSRGGIEFELRKHGHC